MKKILPILLVIGLVFSLTACSGGGASSGSSDLPKVMEELKKQLNNEEMMDLSTDDLYANYGIDAADVTQFAATVDTTGIKADEIVLIEAKDSDAAGRVKEKLEARYQQKCTENKDYLPEQYAIIQKCSVKQQGNYVSMIIAPDAEPLVKAYDESFQ